MWLRLRSWWEHNNESMKWNLIDVDKRSKSIDKSSEKSLVLIGTWNRSAHSLNQGLERRTTSIAITCDLTDHDKSIPNQKDIAVLIPNRRTVVTTYTESSSRTSTKTIKHQVSWWPKPLVSHPRRPKHETLVANLDEANLQQTSIEQWGPRLSKTKHERT